MRSASLENKEKIEIALQIEGRKRDEYVEPGILDLAKKNDLDLLDWIAITGVEADVFTGLHGMYKITPEAIAFKGWPIKTILSEPKWDRKELLDESSHKLLFPCTPHQLVEFVQGSGGGRCGSLFGVIPKDFLDLVMATPAPPSVAECAAIGANRIRINKESSLKAAKQRGDREAEFEKWANEGKRIIATRKPMSDLQLAPLIRKNLGLTAAVATIRKRIGPYMRSNPPKTNPKDPAP